MSNIKGKDAVAISTNICYVLADMLETNLMDLQQIYRANNIAMVHAQKQYFNTAISNVRKLVREVSHTSETTQENYGNDADMMNAIFLLLIDRCGDDDTLLFKWYNYIKSFPSKLNMGIEMDSAFEHIFQRKEDESK